MICGRGFPHFRIKCVELNRRWIAERLWGLNAGSDLSRAGEGRPWDRDACFGESVSGLLGLQFDVERGVFDGGISLVRARRVCQRLAGWKLASVGTDMAHHELSHHALKS